jgi:polysaccharide export outer membrane protein
MSRARAANGRPASRWRRLVALGFIATLTACGGSDKSRYANEPDPRAGEYVIGASDELDIQVWKSPELNTKIRVRPDGYLTMALVGDLKAEGLTPSHLREQITKKLRAFLREGEPVVTVAVTGVNSYHVTVAGSVTTPGRYASPVYLTVADAIALAGGPTRFADPEETVVLRRNGNGTVRRIEVDYERILEGKSQDQNLVLLRGDVVFVP